MRRWMSLLIAAVTAAVVVLVPAEAAHAGVGTFVWVDGGVLVVSGGDLVDAVVVSPVAQGAAVTGYQITAEGPITPGTGCTGGGRAVSCPATGITMLYAWLGPGDDRLHDNTALTKTLYGNDGNDRITLDRVLGTAYLDGGPGDDFLLAGVQWATLSGGAGADFLYGSDDPDYLSGGEGDDILDGFHSADVMVGGNGYDTVTYNTSIMPVTASLDGVVGNDGSAGEGDTIASDVEALEGGQDNDYLVGNESANRLLGLAGEDVVQGLGGADSLQGGPGGDWLDGGAGSDDVRGDAGDDFVLGGPGDDWLVGGSGRDGLVGGAGFDACLPEDGEPTSSCER